MKKIFRLFAAFAATIFAFSCMEEANPETPVTGNGGTSYDGPMITLTFSVDELTKTSYDKENGHQWSEGDQIKIIWGEEENACTIADVVSGYVSAEVGVADTYYAVYPENTAYSLAVPEGETEAQLSVVIPTTQDGSFKQANIMAAKTSLDDKVFAFKNLTHILKFSLSEDSAYKGFQIMSNTSNQYLTGVSAISFGDTINVAEPVKATIGGAEYNKSAVVQVANLPAGGTYYLGIRPEADMSNGFGFKATAEDKTTGWVHGALSKAKVNTARSGITSITNLDKAIRSDYFFKPNGTGNGSTWETAGGVDLLVEFLGANLAEGVTYNKNTNGWRLYGATLHLAEGTYTLPSAQIAFALAVNNVTKVYGGYPSNLSGTTTAGRDAAKYKTILTKEGNNAAVKRMFYSDGSTLYKWTWDGITFTANEGTTIADRGGVFYFNNNTKGTINFSNCIFKNLESTHDSGGGAIDVCYTSSTDLKVVFTNCEFTGNKAVAGGAVVVEKSNSKIVLTFNKCNFNNNVSTGVGGAVSVKAGIVPTFDNCVFSQNTAQTGGGAISNEVGTIIVNGCSFTDNYSTNHGGAICTYGEKLSGNATITGQANAYIYNTLFDNNDVSGDSQGGSIKAHGNGNIVVVNSTFRNSDASTGILRLRSQVVGSTKGWVVGCTFSENNKTSIYNQDSDMWVYNTIMNDANSYYANNEGGNGTFGDVVFLKDNYYYSPGGDVKGVKKAYLTSLENKTQLDASVVGTFNATKGVYPVAGVALTNGMSSTELSALAADITAEMPLFDATKLKVDQKGNSREDKTIMGAYVGE